MTVTVAPMCVGCVHYRREEQHQLACDAFPDGIPEAIYQSKVDHRQPVPGDNGITFDPVDEDAARHADELFP